MADKVLDFAHTPAGKRIAGWLRMPVPPKLTRMQGPYVSKPLEGQAVLLGSAGGAEGCTHALVLALTRMGANLTVVAGAAGVAAVKAAAAQAGLPVSTSQFATGQAESVYVLDMTRATTVADLRLLYDFLNPHLRGMPANSRIVVVAQPKAVGAECQATQHAITGFVRSLAKETGRNGTTANVVQLEPDAHGALEGVLRFLLSPASAYITGQLIPVLGGAVPGAVFEFSEKPLAGKLAVVTGAARGIGAAISAVLAREGATVLGVDLPADEATLGATMSDLGGLVLPLNMCDTDAGQRLAAFAHGQGKSIDILVHNAGITRDKMLRNMKPEWWDSVLEINLNAMVRCNQQLLEDGLAANARLVCISSVGGIAGNAGQTNYAATKSGVIGYVDALSKQLAGTGRVANAVAPGFIETQMTHAMPFVTREVARRLNAFSQGGLPVDVAEAVNFMAGPLALGLGGITLRVCGQSVVGQ